MRKISIISLLLIQSMLLRSQISHDVQIDLSTLFGNVITPNYEMVISDKIGVEVSLEFDRQDDLFFDFRLGGLGMEVPQFASLDFEPSIAAKYYFSHKKKKGHGFFFGPYLRLNYLLKREEGYIELWEERNNAVAPRYIEETGFKSFNPGFYFGYKFLIKERFIVELAASYAFRIISGDLAEDIDMPSQFDFDMELFKLGYRF